MREITLIGGASSKRWQFEVSEEDLSMTLLEFLQSREVPIASSCGGLGVCEKCLYNESELACQIKMEEIDFDIEVAYL
jgi:ferredoxin